MKHEPAFPVMDSAELERIEKMFLPNSVTGYNFIGNTGDAVAAVPALVTAVRERDANLESRTAELAVREQQVRERDAEIERLAGYCADKDALLSTLRTRHERLEKAARAFATAATAEHWSPDRLKVYVTSGELAALRAALKDGGE